MEIKKLGFFQALGVALYCSLIGLFFTQASRIFPKGDPALTPVVMLLLLCTSVLVCALLVFYKPYKLFFEGKKKEAIDVVVFTSLWMFGFVFLAFLLMVLFK